MSALSPCPLLPDAPAVMTAAALAAHGKTRDAAFYMTALTYAQYLWQSGLPARAILCLDRALGADLRGEEPELAHWPLPYDAMAWLLRHHPPGVFIGNPRVHFQHFADRMNEPRRDQRCWRAWACWAITRVVLPDLPGDPQHRVSEPDCATIFDRLSAHGLPGEAGQWRRTVENSRHG
jgi:hypothetical protein